jgi:hypothetical protein
LALAVGSLIIPTAFHMWASGMFRILEWIRIYSDILATRWCFSY